MANIMLAIILFGALVGITNPLVDSAYQKDGLLITSLAEDKTLPAHTSGLTAGMIIKSVEGKTIEDLTGFQSIYTTKKPGDQIAMVVQEKAGSDKMMTLTATLAENKDKKGEPYLGVFFDQAKHAIIDSWWVPVIEWINQLIVWVAAMNFGVGLFNLLPLGIVDGGRMLHVALHRLLKEKHANYTWVAVSGFFFFAVVGSLVISMIKG